MGRNFKETSVHKIDRKKYESNYDKIFGSKKPQIAQEQELEMNLNELAKHVTQIESGKKQVSIAQVKEVIKIVSMEMYLNPDLIAKLINNGKKNHVKQLPALPRFLR